MAAVIPNTASGTPMSGLARALTQAGGADPIETVHGIGYRLVTTDAS